MMLLMLLVLSCLAAVVEPYWNYGCYGDLRTIDLPLMTCGNALETTNCGIPAIERIAQTDIVYLRRYELSIRNVARNLCVQPALIAALISDESRAGSILVNGWNRARSRFGLMQIPVRYYPLVGSWNSEENITQGMRIIITNVRSLRRRFPTWSWQQCWRGGICAYNTGITDVLSYPGMDFCGSNGHFADSVFVKAKYYYNSNFFV